MINYIVYGNTDYLDVLTIQTDYMSGRGYLTLFLNENDLNLDHLYSRYDKVIFYNNDDQYASRVLSCLKKVEDDYFLFLHDIDILLNVNNDTILRFYEFLRYHNFDRVDLKYTSKIKNESLIIKVSNTLDIDKWPTIFKEELNEGVYLVSQTDPTDYIYNVNPSIWKRESFIELLSSFKDKNYRTIEGMDVQNFAKKFKVFKLHSNTKLNCGYFTCLKDFSYLHISHSGKLLPLNSNFTTVYGQPYNDVSEEYIKIVDKYELRKSPKWIH